MTDVSLNYGVKKRGKPFTPRLPDAEDGTWRMVQADVERVQEFRKCIGCYLCQDVCHVIRDHRLHHEFIGLRFFVYSTTLKMHPLDIKDRAEVCPEEITIIDKSRNPLRSRDRVLQHHEVLHEGVSGRNHDYR